MASRITNVQTTQNITTVSAGTVNSYNNPECLNISGTIEGDPPFSITVNHSNVGPVYDNPEWNSNTINISIPNRSYLHPDGGFFPDGRSIEAYEMIVNGSTSGQAAVVEFRIILN